MAKKNKQETITPIQYLYDRTVAGSVPFNWKLFQSFIDKGYKAKRSQEAVLLLGHLVSWQSILTKSNKLRKGYFYRARHHINSDTGLTKQSQQKVEELLQSEGLIKVKPYSGQANYYQVDIDETLKILDQAQKEYTTRTKSGQEPGPEVATNNINNNIHNNDKGQGIASKMQPISFYEYQKRYKIDPNVRKEVNIIEYFLEKHAQVIGPGKHKDLKPVTWSEQLDTISSVELDNGKFDDALESDDLKDMINHYFSKANDGKYQSNCDFSIVHFNNPGIKKVNFYESSLITSCYDDGEE